MTTNIKSLSFTEARDLVFKSMDQNSPEYKVLLKYHPQIIKTFECIVDTLDKAMNDMTTYEDIGRMPEDIANEIDILSWRMPTYLLLNSALNFGPLYNAMILLMKNYLNLYEVAYSQAEETEWRIAYLKNVKNTIARLDSIVVMIQVGISYIDLMRASQVMIDEMRSWQDQRPTMLKLSDAYLRAINFKEEN